VSEASVQFIVSPVHIQHYGSRMYRALVLFPKSADPMEADVLIEGTASSLKASRARYVGSRRRH
jgi:hypothetical protein